MTYAGLPKRAFDLVVALVGAVALSPVMAVTAFVVRYKLGAPVLFRHERAGKGGVPFVLLKFRSMTPLTEPSADDADRLTSVGSMLRRWSLDELPSIWNVVRGELSIVGPRPLPLTYVTRYSDIERRRLELRPGLTGWAQVNGRNDVAWEDRLAMDVWYVDHIGLGLDFRILLATIRTVMKGNGVSAEGHATMPELRPTASNDS